jgi:hypothetical protein
MENHTIEIKLKEGDPLWVSRERLTVDSRIFRYLIDELKYDELEMDDFSTEAVFLFLTILEDKKLGEIEDAMFRELHKMAVVFEVAWLREGCRGTLRSRMTSAQADQDKLFLFEETWYILKRWKERDLMDALISSLAHQDNTTFISVFMSNIYVLETEQMDLVAKLGGSNANLFLGIILNNLAGQRTLGFEIKHLLQNINLALSWEQNAELYLEVFDAISNLPDISVDDMRFTHRIRTDTQRMIISRSEKRRVKTNVVYNLNKYRLVIRGCTTFNDIIDAVSDGSVSTMYAVVELLLYGFYVNASTEEDKQVFLSSLGNICCHKGLQKISLQYLDMIIAALKFSHLEQSDQLIALLDEMKRSSKITTCHENVII